MIRLLTVTHTHIYSHAHRVESELAHCGGFQPLMPLFPITEGAVTKANVGRAEPASPPPVATATATLRLGRRRVLVSPASAERASNRVQGGEQEEQQGPVQQAAAAPSSGASSGKKSGGEGGASEGAAAVDALLAAAAAKVTIHWSARDVAARDMAVQHVEQQDKDKGSSGH